MRLMPTLPPPGACIQKRDCDKGMDDVATELDAVRTDSEEGGGGEVRGENQGLSGGSREGQAQC